MRIQNILPVWIIFVTGCGGGGSGPTPEPPATSSNNKPVFSSSSTFSVRENETSIGTVTATDADGDTVSYSISGTDASSISIDSSTGILSFISAPDYEAVQSYSVTALVSDGSDEASQNISITILNIDPPSIDKIFFSENSNGGLSEEIILSQSEHIFSSRTTNNGSVDQLVASFEYTGTSVSIGDTIQESGSTVNDFTEIVTYSVTNSDGDVEEYTVDLMRFTGLPIVYLKTDDAVAIDSKEDYVQGDTSLDGGRDFDNLDDLEMKIRGRGNSTWGLHPKKPFQMKLSDKAEFLGMPNDKKWLFLAEYSDKTMLRNKISFEMGYISNLDWTPQGRFAEVYINDEYNGTYNVTQKVEESDNRVPLGDTGYLLELDQLERLDSDDVYFESVITEKFLVNIKEPNLERNSSEYVYIKTLINDFENAMLGSTTMTSYFAVSETTSDNVWDVNLSQTMRLVPNSEYRVSFKAKSSIDRTMIAGLGLYHDPWTNVGEPVSLTTAWQTFTLTQTTTDFGDDQSRVLFDMGGDQGGEVWIDDVSVLNTDGEELIINGDFQSGESSWAGGAATAANITSYSSGAETYAEYIDIDSFVDWYLISEITKNVDSKSFSSMFLNVLPGEKIKMGPLWDFDLSFGNVDYADSRYAEGWWVKYHPWYERLFQDPDFVDRVKVRFAYFKDNQDFILEKIDTYAQQLQWAQQENDNKWQTLGIYVWPNPVIFDTYQEEVDHMKAWYGDRMTWLDNALTDL
ncbi:CotH kinase family protein [Porticoccaceae bacterium]|nr:CotH kinase family protein [Porticoccaceae bacterium]